MVSSGMNPRGPGHAQGVPSFDGKVLLQMRLQNLRRNRQNCPASHRSGFDQLIRMVEAELRAADAPDYAGAALFASA